MFRLKLTLNLSSGCNVQKEMFLCILISNGLAKISSVHFLSFNFQIRWFKTALLQGTRRWLFLNSSRVKAVFQGMLCTHEIYVSIFWHPQFAFQLMGGRRIHTHTVCCGCKKCNYKLHPMWKGLGKCTFLDMSRAG